MISPDAKEWLKISPSIPYMDIELSPGRITANITRETKDLLEFLKDNGIDYGDPELILCG